MFCVVLESKSARADITADWVAKVAAAITTQLQRDFAPDYGIAAWTCTADPTASGPRVIIFDTSDQAGALGYHAVGPDDLPYGKVFADGQSLDGVSVTVSHEVLELVGDQGADRYRFAPSGTGYAEEACDAVEDQTYAIDGIAVSDFVTPAWYDPSSQGPWDHLSVLKAPLTRTDGGYTIRMQGGAVSTEPAQARARKAHPASRTSRRFARAVPA